jgi:diguanylate cyclase (GGDEF)-like protein
MGIPGDTKNWLFANRAFKIAEIAASCCFALIVGFVLFETLSLKSSAIEPVNVSYQLLKTHSSQGEIPKSKISIVDQVPISGSSIQAMLNPGDRALIRFRLPNLNGMDEVHLRMLRLDSAEFWIENSNTRTPIYWRASNEGLVLVLPKLLSQNVQGFVVNGVIKVKDFSRPNIRLTKAAVDPSNPNSFDVSGGFYSGALIAIAIFSLTISIIAKDFAFVIFSLWVLSTLRIALINGGWDLVWIGISNSWMGSDFLLRISLAFHAVFTASLFRQLSWSFLSPGQKRLLCCMEAFCLLTALAVLGLTYQSALPFVWVVSLVSSLIVIGVALNISYRRGNRALSLVAIGWAIGIIGLIVEIGVASGYIPTNIKVFINSQVSALISVLLTASALAERINTERNRRIRAQDNELIALGRVKLTYQQSPAGLATFDNKDQLVRLNAAFQAIFNRQIVVGANLSALVGELNATALKNSADWVEFGLHANNGALLSWVRARAISRDENLELAFLDITDQKIAEEKLQEAANRDPLTNLYNRFKMIDLLDQRLVTNVDATTPTDCIAMIDIDAFDRVITNFGHGVGDDVLLAYRDRIQEQLPPTATLGRLSADTFLVLMPSTPLNEARYVMQAILNSIHKAPFETRVLTVAIKASVGVSVIESKTSKEVLAACDSALQDAKAKGGGQLIAYGERDKAWLAHKVEQELMAEFSQAIPFERFQIVMQPIVSLLNAKEDIRYEALIRMKGKDGKMLSPAAFLPALEKIGLMSQLDRWVVRQVLEFLERESDHFAKLTYASVNLSGASINDERFTDELLRLAAKHPHLVRKVCFEITENIALSDMEATKRFIHRLRTIGARIALDDFGAGYSSFSYLAQLKVDSIKIDGSLVTEIDDDLAKQAIVKTIVDLGKALGSEVVAEWVETPKILATLSRLGVDAGQGWALGKPVSMDIIASAEHGASFVTDKNIAATLGFSLLESANA